MNKLWYFLLLVGNEDKQVVKVENRLVNNVYEQKNNPNCQRFYMQHVSAQLN